MNKRPKIYDCTIIELPRIADRRGNITPVYNNLHLPFAIERVFYLYDIPAGESRGAHAHKECHQFLIAASGSFEVACDDGVNKRTFSLNRPYYGLHIPPMIWAHEMNFSSGAICLVLTSMKYDPDDYIRDYEEFLERINLFI
ncbi:MAG: FdtA/QdtA family cupin domain-containing protein [Candidatus Kapabacteria bacterium]|nr:FdtA/QdtA family cupin domain-containing protein [Candidatus Kapabacteria bacterium]